jgi:uncharacterized membrane protein
MRLPAGGPLGAGIWIFIAALTGLALWLLVRRCARIGRWKAVGISLGAIAVLAVLSSVVGDVEARMWPDNGMAGVGAGIFAWILALFGIVVLAMGAVSIVLDDRRRPRRASEEARVVDPA